jgi:hypothetical protein
VGESGENPRKKHKRHHHVRLNARAIAEGWDVPLEERPKIIQEVIRIAMGDESARDKLRAAETLMRVPGIQIGAAQLKLAQDATPGSEATESLVDRMDENDAAFEQQSQNSEDSQEMPQ